MKYTNQFGESVQISASDEIWLNDEFFAREMAKLPSDALRAGLAYRVSTKGQVDHDDIPMQKIECRKFCAQHGWRVVLEKAEKGVSGSKVSATKRDAIQELKAEAEKGNIDILLVFLFDRLGRIESETPYVVEWFVKHGVEVWSTREGRQTHQLHPLLAGSRGVGKDCRTGGDTHSAAQFQRPLQRRYGGLWLSGGA